MIFVLGLSIITLENIGILTFEVGETIVVHVF